MKMIPLKPFALALLLTCPLSAATRAHEHTAVFSSGFLVDTQRQVTYGERARNVQIISKGQGTAKGEALSPRYEIDRLDQGLIWILDPIAKTYSETRYQASRPAETSAVPSGTPPPATLRVSSVDTQRSVALGTATLQGHLCTSYVLRLTAKFSDSQTKKVVATETLIEKLWVTENAPDLAAYRQTESDFEKDLQTSYGVEKANFRWLLREFNRNLLELNGKPEDFKTIQEAYRVARAQIKGVTVRQLAGWNWRVEDPTAPASYSATDLHSFIGAIAAGLGAPPPTEGKSPLTQSQTPKWVQDLASDLGRSGPSAMILNEITDVKTVKASPETFEVPVSYRKQ